MIQIIKRLFRSAWQSFIRNGWLSIATIVIMALSIFIFSGVLLFNTASRLAIKTIEDKVDISIYFLSDTPEEDIFKIQEQIKSLAYVSDASYVSSQQALETFTQLRQSDPLIAKALQEIGENPLSASLNIKTKKVTDYDALATYIQEAPFKDKLISVDFSQNQKVISRLGKLTKGLSVGSLFLNLILALVAVVVSFNTIRMAIYALREEISIMKLSGASNWFIRGPFVINGILCGIIAAVSVLIILIPLVLWLHPKVSAFMPGFNLNAYFFGHIFVMLGWQLLFGAVLGAVSSVLAVTKYLKV